MVSSPMFAPTLIPETIMSGMFSSRPVTAICTQSVGVPFTNRNPFADRRTESGRSSVRELEGPLRARSGAAAGRGFMRVDPRERSARGAGLGRFAARVSSAEDGARHRRIVDLAEQVLQ